MRALRGLFLWLLLSASACMAAQVFHKELVDVLKPDRPVIKATVVRSEVEILPDLLQVRVEVKDVEPLYLQVPDALLWVHSYSTLINRQTQDGRPLRVSPLREGSGLERNLVVGERYLFILGAEGDLVRVEEPEKEAIIKKILLNTPKEP